MRKILGVLLVAMIVFALAGLTQARGAPQHDQPFAVEKMVAEIVPSVDVLPPLAAVETRLNQNEQRTLTDTVTTANQRQSTTGAWHSDVKQQPNARSSPDLVLLT